MQGHNVLAVQSGLISPAVVWGGQGGAHRAASVSGVFLQHWLTATCQRCPNRYSPPPGQGCAGAEWGRAAFPRAVLWVHCPRLFLPAALLVWLQALLTVGSLRSLGWVGHQQQAEDELRLLYSSRLTHKGLERRNSSWWGWVHQAGPWGSGIPRRLWSSRMLSNHPPSSMSFSFLSLLFKIHWSTLMVTSCCREVQHSIGHPLAASVAVGSWGTAVLCPKLQAGGLELLSPVPSCIGACWVPAHRMVSEENFAHSDSGTGAPASRLHQSRRLAVGWAAAPCACPLALGGVLVPAVPVCLEVGCQCWSS